MLVPLHYFSIYFICSFNNFIFLIEHISNLSVSHCLFNDQNPYNFSFSSLYRVENRLKLILKRSKTERKAITLELPNFH